MWYQYTGRPGMMQFMGSQRVRHDWATDLIWSDFVCKLNLLLAQVVVCLSVDIHIAISKNVHNEKLHWKYTMFVLVPQLCLRLCHPVDCSTPGSSAHIILQPRILERVAISFYVKIHNYALSLNTRVIWGFFLKYSLILFGIKPRKFVPFNCALWLFRVFQFDFQLYVEKYSNMGIYCH